MLESVAVEKESSVISLKDYIAEQSSEQPYRLMLIIYDDPLDPNKTGEEIKKEWAKNNNPKDFYQFEIDKGYFTINEKGNYVAHNYTKENDNRRNVKPNPKEDEFEHDEVGFEIIPENTVVVIRGSKGDRTHRFTEMLRLKNVYMVNSRKTMEVANDKWLNYIHFKEAGLRQPRTSLITSVETIDIPIKEVGGKYPMILKTAMGTRGVGVQFVESYKSLLTSLQLILKIDEDIPLILQEYIKTDYDVRAIVLNNEVVAQLKRPVIKGDFRSNISQGTLPEKMELTDLEIEQCLKAAKETEVMWGGFDFIPSKNRETEPPYFIEFNGSPGTGHLNEFNDINIYKMFIDTFKNKENWT